MSGGFFQLSVGKRLGLGFGSLLALLLLVTLLAANQVRSMGARVREVVDVNNAKSALANALLHEVDAMGLQVRGITLQTDVALIEADVRRLEASRQRYLQGEQALAEMSRSHPGEDGETAALEATRQQAQAALPLIEKAAKLGQAGSNIDATLVLTDAVAPAEARWREAIGKLVALQEQASRGERDALAATERRGLMLLGGLALLAMVLGAVLARRISHSITRPVDRAIVVAGRIAKGDLSSSFVPESSDELGQLLAGLAAMQEQLRTLVGDIRSAADSIQTASQEVAAGNQDLSGRTEQAASHLQQAASSVVELTDAVGHSADSAAQANQLAHSAATVAGRGGEVVADVVRTMDEINQSSRRIGDIIGVIDGIAFQTNILALNAAVEAARAGEQGRGFAVVAGEVRTLAQRSAEAAREIKTLVTRSVDTVDTGTRLVGDAGSTMGDIVASVQRVADIIGDISSAASEQRNGIGQVNRSVGELDQMTQQNAALVEQSAAAAASLQQQSRRLGDLVGAFVLSREDRRED